MSNPFFDHPILNSPYERPERHWELDAQGQPTQRVVESRRRASFITPIPKPKKRKTAATQEEFVFDEGQALSTKRAAVRRHLDHQRGSRTSLIRGGTCSNPSQWQVTPETARLLQHWRHHAVQRRPARSSARSRPSRPLIWLTEVAPQSKTGKRLLEHLAAASRDANPELQRLALKLATGAGKTTVMAMIIAWQTINAVRRPGSKHFTRGFLVVHPGAHDQGPPSRSAAQRPRQLLRQPRARPRRHARRCEPGEDRHHQLPRVQAARTARALGRRACAASRARWRRPPHAGDRRPDAPARDARPDGHEEHSRAERRGASLLPREADRARRRRPEGRREEGGGEEQRGGPTLDLGPRSRESQARSRPGGRSIGDALLSSAARATPRGRSSRGP